MSRVLAFVDDSPIAVGVTRTAAWIAGLLSATVDPVRAHHPDAGPKRATSPPDGVRMVEGPTIEVLIDELGAEDVEAAVVGSRSVDAKAPGLGHVAEELLTRADRPLVVVPPRAPDPADGAGRILVPLDGTEPTTAALLPLAERLALAGATIVIVHVFDAESLPPFIESFEDLEVIAAELARRHLPGLARHCELRVGAPAAEVARVVDDERPDLVLLAWHQDLAPDHASVMRRLLHDTQIPLVVVPVPDHGRT